jgi:glycosyltransferase involved in cell wall biosynthesis
VVRILHIHTLPVISGSGINTFLTMQGMKGNRYESVLACAPGGALIDLVQRHGIEVKTFPNLVQPLHPLKDFLAILDLTSHLIRRPYHVVHTHNSKAGFIGRLSAKLARVPVIVHTVHGFAFHEQEPPWRQFLFRNLERLASHWCDKMIFISQPLVDWALKERISCTGKMARIYSGIELDRFHPVSEQEKMRLREKWGLQEQDDVIGIVSKLWDGKGHELLIRAFREIKKEKEDARLVIVGEGYLMESLKGVVRQLELSEAVIFTGFLEDVPQIIATFDVAVLPSFFEGMGRVLLEAMAMEKPVVGTLVGGIPDLIEHGANGYLVSPGKERELASAVLKILNDKGLAVKMGEAGRKKVTDRFSADTMVRSIEKVYGELLEKKGVCFDS